MEEKILFWEALFLISSVLTRNHLFKVSNWSTRIICEKCSRLKMKTLEQSQSRSCNVYIVNCEHVSNFLLIVDFEQVEVCWVHIEKINTFEDSIRDIMRYVIVIYVWLKFINKKHLTLHHHNPMGESVKKSFRRSLFQTLIRAKKMRLTFKMTCCSFVFLSAVFYRFCCWETN